MTAALLEFGNFANGDFSEFADASGANYGPSTGRTTIQPGGPNGGNFARMTADNKSHLYGDLANNRIHLIGFAGGIPAWWKQGAWIYGAISMRLPTVQGANTRYAYAGLEVHGANGTGPAPTNIPFQRGGWWWWIERGGSETDGHFDSQWEFGPQRSTPDGQHHHQDWVGGNVGAGFDVWAHFRFDKLLDPKAGAFRLQYGHDVIREVVPLKEGIPTCYPNGSTPFLSLYQQTATPGKDDPDTARPGLQVVDYAAGCFASTAAERDAWQDARLGIGAPTPPPPADQFAAARAKVELFRKGSPNIAAAFDETFKALG